MTVFDQSNVVSAGAMADTIFVASLEWVVVSRAISALIMRIKQTFNFVGAARAISRPVIYQVSMAGKHFCIKFSQWKSHYFKNVCLSSTHDMDILLVVCGVTRISILDYFCVKL